MKELKIVNFVANSEDFSTDGLQEVLSQMDASQYEYILKVDIGDALVMDGVQILRHISSQLSERKLANILVVPVGTSAGVLKDIQIVKIDSVNTENNNETT